MGKLLDLLQAAAGESPLRSLLGRWRQEVSREVDEASARIAEIEIVAAGEASALAGPGLVPDGTQLAVGQNADGSIVVNADDIQVSAVIQTGAAAGATALQVAGDGLTEAPAGQVNVGANADGSIVVNPDDIQVSAAIQSGAALGATSLQVAGAGLTESPAGTANVGANADNSIIVNADNIQLNPAFGLTVTGGFSYQTQATWYIAPTGNNANNGATPGTPIPAYELARRFAGRVVPQNTTVNASGVFTDPLTISNVIVEQGFSIQVVGEAPTTQYSGSLTGAFVAYAPLTNVDAKVVDAARSFAADPQRRIRMTSGAANGAITWIMKDLTGNTARVGQFIRRTDGRMVAPALADTYVIETLNTQFGGIYVDVKGGGSFKATDLIINRATSGRSQLNATGLDVASFDGSTFCVLDGCRFTGSNNEFTQSNANLLGCSNAGSVRWFGGRANLFGNVGFAQFAENDAADVLVSAHSVQQAANWGVFGASQLVGSLDSAFAAASIGVYDLAGGLPPIDTDVFGSVQTIVANSVVFGSGNTTATNVRMRSGSQGVYITKWVITGTGSDATVGGTARTWAQIPYVEPTNNAMIVVRA